MAIVGSNRKRGDPATYDVVQIMGHSGVQEAISDTRMWQFNCITVAVRYFADADGILRKTTEVVVDPLQRARKQGLASKVTNHVFHIGQGHEVELTANRRMLDAIDLDCANYKQLIADNLVKHYIFTNLEGRNEGLVVHDFIESLANACDERRPIRCADYSLPPDNPIPGDVYGPPSPGAQAMISSCNGIWSDGGHIVAVLKHHDNLFPLGWSASINQPYEEMVPDLPTSSIIYTKSRGDDGDVEAGQRWLRHNREWISEMSSKRVRVLISRDPAIRREAISSTLEEWIAAESIKRHEQIPPIMTLDPHLYDIGGHATRHAYQDPTTELGLRPLQELQTEAAILLESFTRSGQAREKTPMALGALNVFKYWRSAGKRQPLAMATPGNRGNLRSGRIERAARQAYQARRIGGLGLALGEYDGGRCANLSTEINDVVRETATALQDYLDLTPAPLSRMLDRSRALEMMAIKLGLTPLDQPFERLHFQEFLDLARDQRHVEQNPPFGRLSGFGTAPDTTALGL